MTEQTPRREAPDWVSRAMVSIKGKQYLPAAVRIAWFREEHPDWCLVTTLEQGGFEQGYAVVRASVLTPDGVVIASAVKSQAKAGWADFWEKAETGACGRALALAGYGTMQALELEEGDSIADSPQQAGNGTQVQPRALLDAEMWDGPGQCPQCHCPEGKRHATTCRASAQGAQAAGR